MCFRRDITNISVCPGEAISFLEQYKTSVYLCDEARLAERDVYVYVTVIWCDQYNRAVGAVGPSGFHVLRKEYVMSSFAILNVKCSGTTFVRWKPVRLKPFYFCNDRKGQPRASIDRYGRRTRIKEVNLIAACEIIYYDCGALRDRRHGAGPVGGRRRKRDDVKSWVGRMRTVWPQTIRHKYTSDNGNEQSIETNAQWAKVPTARFHQVARQCGFNCECTARLVRMFDRLARQRRRQFT